MSRIRAGLLGLLAMMLVGSVVAATASAEGGPYWHHRAVEGKGEGLKIEPNAPESFSGKGGEQILLSSVISEAKEVPVEISSSSVQVKGAIFNNENQGQIKLELVYNQPTLRTPKFPECSVTVGEKNIVVVKGHLMWKWNGEKKQLEEKPQLEQQPDIVFTQVEPVQQKPFVEKVKFLNGIFTTIGFKGKCGPLTAFPITGSEVGIPFPHQLEEWSKKLAVRTMPPQNGIFFQHYWDGTGFQGAEIGLSFNNRAASLIGQTEVESAQQEIATFEK